MSKYLNYSQCGRDQVPYIPGIRSSTRIVLIFGTHLSVSYFDVSSVDIMADTEGPLPENSCSFSCC
jgi:hypothetical protein